MVELKAHFILVTNGGNLSIGSPTVPYAGPGATITLYGAPDSRELPLYGPKVIALRDGNVVLHGLPKTPSWTQLAATANANDTSIVVKDAVNWAVGDAIAIASSSFLAEEVDTVDITSVSVDPSTGTTTLGLSGPLLFTHLGVVMSDLAGDASGKVLDMRAEVAVLTRNVVLQGDESSEDYMYGAQVRAFG